MGGWQGIQKALSDTGMAAGRRQRTSTGAVGQPDTCSFTIKPDAGFVPVAGQPVVVASNILNLADRFSPFGSSYLSGRHRPISTSPKGLSPSPVVRTSCLL